MKSAVIAMTRARADRLADEIPVWVADRLAERDANGNAVWTARLFVTTAADGYAAREEYWAEWQREAFDHLVIVGSTRDMPTIWVQVYPDGHVLAGRWLPGEWALVSRDPLIDSMRQDGDHSNRPYIAVRPFSAVSRVWLEDETSVADVDEAYRDYFAKRHSQSQQDYRLQALFDDHLNYTDFGGNPYHAFGDAVVKQFARYPWMLDRQARPGGDVAPFDGALLDQSPTLVRIYFSGGKPTGLYYVGATSDFVASPPNSLVCAFWGSMEGDLETLDNLPRAALTGPHCVVSIYDMSSMYDALEGFQWSTFLAGGTVGEAALESAAESEMAVSTLLGDCTFMADATTQQNLQILAQVQQNTADIADLKSQVLKLSQGTPPVARGSIVITKAIYRKVYDDHAGVDCTAIVQALVDSGKPFFVYSETQPCLMDPSWPKLGGRDPFYGFKKELYAEGTKDGVEFARVFGQEDQVII